MGIASVSLPGPDGEPVGETVFGGAAADIGKAEPPPARVDRRLAAVAAAATLVQDNRGASGPVAWSKAAKVSLRCARAMGG